MNRRSCPRRALVPIIELRWKRALPSIYVHVTMNEADKGRGLSQRNSSLATFSYSAQIAASEKEAVAVSKEIPFASAQLDKIYHRQRALRAQAANDFAALNNWQVSLTPFPLLALTSRHSLQPAITNYRQILFGDHPPVLFRENSPLADHAKT
jgi:hypothetical protein